MKFLIFFIFITSFSLHAQSTGYPSAIDFVTTAYPEKNPSITVKLANDVALKCEFDAKVKIYVCPDRNNPILIKPYISRYEAIGRDSKNEVNFLSIKSIESKGEIIYAKAIPPEKNSHDLRILEAEKQYLINNFFQVNLKVNKRETGSDQYEKISNEFIVEIGKNLEKIKEISKQKTYQIELTDGKKLTCNRDATRTLTKEETELQNQGGVNLQCGVFNCGKVNEGGKEYEAILIHESSIGFGPSSFQLISKDKISSIPLKKIISDETSIPVLDNSDLMKNLSYYSTYQVDKGLEEKSPFQALSKSEIESYVTYRGPAFTQLMKYYKKMCPETGATFQKIDSSTKNLGEKVANLELAQLIKVLDGQLIGEFINPTKANSYGCLYEGVYLNPEAARKLEKIKKNIHPHYQESETISLEMAKKLFKKAQEMKDIAWKYKTDGCYARAHLMARRFEKLGVRVDKVWIKGDLFVEGTEPLINWNFHVAPLVYVKDSKGIVEKMVIDPSLFDHPVTVEEWDHKMSKNTVKGSAVTAFPFPVNSALVERSSLAFSTSDPYLPSEDINTTEENKMLRAKQTMADYKTLEPK